MKIQISHVDLSALPAWPYRVLAVNSIHKAVDPHHALRLSLDTSLALAPPEIAITRIRPGLFQLTRVVA